MSVHDKEVTLVEEHWLAGGGEMGARMRAFDWSRSPLGPVQKWPQSLKTCVRIVLTSRQPMFVWWGEHLINLYNDPYKSIVGGKHPEALGQPASVVWKEIWNEVGPRAESAMRRNEGTYDEALLLIMERFGYREETYYTFSYSPVPNDEGGIGGILCANTEDTARIIGERQLALLRELASRTAQARTWEAVCEASVQALQTNAHDIPFALIYLLDDDKQAVSLAAGCRLGSDHSWAPARISLADASLWPAAAVVHGHATVPVSLRELSLAFPRGAWQESPHQAVALPIPAAGETGKGGMLVVGLSPHRLCDDNYKGFLTLVAGQIAASIANAEAYRQEKRRAEALAELDRAKTAFFSNVSHEFRTPLTLMLGPIEDELRDRPHAPRLEVAHRNSLRLLKLVNQMLDFSRIEAGRVQAIYVPTDLPAYTAELAGVFRSAIEQAGLRLTVDCPPLEEPLYVDRDMWEKMVLNLLSNAFKFTFTGEITVSLHPDGRYVELLVCDTGIGIAGDELPRVFDRFHRVEGAQGRTHEGTGIGLALVQELTRLHGGTVDVESVYGQGSTFRLRIPRGRAHLPPDRIGSPSAILSAHAVEATAFVEEALGWLPAETGVGSPARPGLSGIMPAQSPGTPPVRPRVLLADDNADMRDYVQRILSERFEVTSVADGKSALAAAQDGLFDLVLTDVMMPHLDGFELLSALRKEERTRQIPVIMLSARAGEESRVEGFEAGADDYLVKPFSARELLARVAAHLELGRVRREAGEALRQRHAQFETLLNAAPLGVYLVDAGFRLIQVNPTARAVFGDIPDLIGRSFDEVLRILWPQAYADEIVAVFRRTLETGEPYFVPERMEERRDRGVVEYYEWQIHRIPLPDGSHGVVCYFRDISGLVRTREAVAESEARFRSLASQLEHLVAERTEELMQSQVRLRALATELNLAEHRERKRVAAELHDHLAQLLVLGRLKLGQAKRVAGLVPLGADLIKQAEDVLDESLSYTRTLVAELSPPVLQEFGLSAALKWLAERMKRHDLDVTVRIVEDNGRLLEEHAVLIFQSVRELLINVSKHAGVREATVSMSCTRERLVLEVRDTGQGFDADMTLTTRVAKSGSFGLFSIRERMKALGGSFELESSPGTGSTARMTLTLTGMPAQGEKQEAKQLSGSLPSNVRPKLSTGAVTRVLLVDDHAMVRQGLRSVLESYNDIEVVGEASDGEQAVADVERLQPAIVVMDINMPRMNGIDATGQITRRYPHVHVIGLSINAGEDNRAAMIQAGASLLLTKEAAVEELYQAVQTVLTRHATQDPVT